MQKFTKYSFSVIILRCLTWLCVCVCVDKSENVLSACMRSSLNVMRNETRVRGTLYQLINNNQQIIANISIESDKWDELNALELERMSIAVIELHFY